MEIWFSMLSILIGILSTLVTIDFLSRRAAIKEMTSTKEKLDDIIVNMQSVHNDLAKKVIEIEDRVAQHDFQLNTRIKK